MTQQEIYALLDPYYPGIANVPEDIAIRIIIRSRGKCEVPGCDCKGEEIHHIVMGRRRRVCIYSLVHLCKKHHRDAERGCHGSGEGRKLQEMFERILEDKYEELGFDVIKIEYLMNRTDGKNDEEN